MNATKLHNSIPLKWWTGLTVLVLLIILIVGLRPKIVSPHNHAKWITDRTGLRFEKYGIAYTDSISNLIRTDIIPRNSFSIEFAIKAKDFSEEGFHFILLLHGGRDIDQLLIGQWRSSLIVMNGDDYEHSRKTPRLTVTSSDELPETQFLTVTTGSDGTRIYLDGRLAAAKKDMRLELPKGENVRLVAGNSVYGSHPWEGDLYGLAVFDKALSEDEVATHYSGWSGNLNFTFTQTLAPVILYNLDQTGINRVTQGADDSHALQVPPRMKPLLPSFFFQNWDFRKVGRNLFKDLDAALNLFGFIPLGLLLGATLIKVGGKFRAHCVSISLATGFLVSLWIETLQAWMPVRGSDMQDLILNTAGTLVGALCCKYFLLSKEKGTEGTDSRKLERAEDERLRRTPVQEE